MAKRTPEQVWKKVLEEAAEDERAFQEAANKTVEESERDLTASGVDVKAVRAEGAAWRREIEERVAARKRAAAEDEARRRSSRPARSQQPAMLLFAAVVAGAAVGGGVVYAMTHRAPPAPSPAPSSPAPSPQPPSPVDTVVPDLIAASDLRRKALSECDGKAWDACLADLDRARALDPDGDDTPPVTSARHRAITESLKNLKPRAP